MIPRLLDSSFLRLLVFSPFVLHIFIFVPSCFLVSLFPSLLASSSSHLLVFSYSCPRIFSSLLSSRFLVSPFFRLLIFSSLHLLVELKRPLVFSPCRLLSISSFFRLLGFSSSPLIVISSRRLSPALLYFLQFPIALKL